MRPDEFYCTRCRREFRRQRDNFPASQSPLFRGNNGYLTVCRECVDDMYAHYLESLGDEKAAIRRICMKFDIYWSERVYGMLRASTTAKTPIYSYIGKANLMQFRDKTFDDTLDEEMNLYSSGAGIVKSEISGAVSNTLDPEEILVQQDIIDFWGAGLAPSFYLELEKRFAYWYGEGQDRDELDVGECALIKQICMLEVSIIRDTAHGKAVDKLVGQLNTLIGSVNKKPVQKKDGDADNIDGTPLGVWIRRWENERPIPEPDPEFKDVNGIVRYIDIWLRGHLCKMLGIKNSFSKLYEEEIARMRIDRPEYEDDDDETFFNDIFGEEDGDGEE